MKRDAWERIQTIFFDALQRHGAARAAFLDDACAGDSELRREVEDLVAQHEADPQFLETPLAQLPPADPVAEPVSIEPSHIAHYRLVRPLGRGGMGEVYLAVQEGPGFERPVALKVIRRGMDTDEVLRRFELERRILASLRHPNIGQLLDAGATADGRPYFVMEYVMGLPIDEYCDDSRCTVPERLRLFHAVCNAVQHAHSNLIVHRDIKPGNILVGPDGEPKLLDFGIGRLLRPEDGLPDAPATRVDLRMFTPEYASPEHIRGDPVTAASDVYGLGVLLYELLTGRRPHEARGRSVAELERAVLEEEPERPSTAVRSSMMVPAVPSPGALGPADRGLTRGTDRGRLRRALVGDLDNIVMKALSKEPEHRYSSAAALAEDIRRHLDGLPVRARPDTFTYRAGKFVRRHRLPLSAAALVFIALVSSTAYSLTQSRRVARERDKALEVQRFLLEMFGATSPDQATGDTVTARQLLDRQVELLDRSYASQPEVKAQMTAVLAEGYDRLGLLSQAEPLARQALDLRRQVLDATHPDVAASLGLLGWVLHEQGRSSEGEGHLREAMAIWRGSRSVDEAAFSRILNDLGIVREVSGDYREAEALYREALDLRRQLFGEGHWIFGITASNLSVVLYRKGEYREAVAVAEDALRAMRQALGPDHQRSIIIQNNLAAMKLALGDYAAAEADYRDLLDRQTRLQGRQHPVTAGVLLALGSVLKTRGRFGDAEPILREAAENLEVSLGPSHPRVAGARARLGGVLSGLGRFDEARPMIEQALAVQRAAYGDGHIRVAESLGELATLHWRGGDLDTAERVQREAVDVWERAVGRDHPDPAKARARLAQLLLERGRSEEALALYRDAHQTLVKHLPPQSDFVHETRLRMALALMELGEHTAADSLLRAGAAGLEAGEATQEQRALLDSLREALEQQGRRPSPR